MKKLACFITSIAEDIVVVTELDPDPEFEQQYQIHKVKDDDESEEALVLSATDCKKLYDILGSMTFPETKAKQDRR